MPLSPTLIYVLPGPGHGSSHLSAITMSLELIMMDSPSGSPSMEALIDVVCLGFIVLVGDGSVVVACLVCVM